METEALRKYILDVLDYDPETGFLTWKKSPRNNANLGGKRAGSPGSRCRNIGVLGQRYREHRIIFLYVTGRWPSLVDHANVDGFDNRWCNLREATWSQNNTNVFGRGRSGFKGVYPKRKRWQARIIIDGKIRSLGVYALPELAHAAYCKKATELYGEFARLA